jgi:hypothetical protein
VVHAVIPEKKSVSDQQKRQMRDKASGNYPKDVDLRVGSKIHDKLIKMLETCCERGYAANSETISEIQEVDRQLDGFMEADWFDKQMVSKDPRRPMTVVFPMAAAHNSRFLTAMHRTFNPKEILHFYEGPGGRRRAANAEIAARVIGYQSKKFRERRANDIHWGQAHDHGRAYMWGKWSKKTAPAYTITQVDDVMELVLGQMGEEAYRSGDLVRHLSDETEVLCEGTEWIPLDNYQVLIDQSKAPDNFHDSGFFGWVTSTDSQVLMTSESDPEENLFNCEALHEYVKQEGGLSRWWRSQSQREEAAGVDPDNAFNFQGESTEVHVVYMIVRLIPSDFELSDGKKSQLWMFAMAADNVIIMAHQLRHRHGEFPVVCTAPNARGHQTAPVSHLMRLLGPHKTVNYIIKSRMQHLWTEKNGRHLLDPDIVDIRRFKELTAQGGPFIIPLQKDRPADKSLDQAHRMLVSPDTTANVWGDVAQMLALTKENEGVQDPSQLPERVTATGIQALQQNPLGIIALTAMRIDEQSFQRMGYQMLCNTTQFMGGEVLIDILGNKASLIREQFGLQPYEETLSVSSWDIDPHLDVQGVLTGMDGGVNTQALVEFSKTIMAQPGVMPHFLSRYNLDAVLARTWEQIGLGILENYRIDFMDDEALAQQVQAGNYAPLGVPNPNQPMQAAPQQVMA